MVLKLIELNVLHSYSRHSFKVGAGLVLGVINSCSRSRHSFQRGVGGGQIWLLSNICRRS